MRAVRSTDDVLKNQRFLGSHPEGVRTTKSLILCPVLKNLLFLACENQRFSRRRIKDSSASHDEVVRTNRRFARAIELFDDVERRRDIKSPIPVFTSDDWDAFEEGLVNVYGTLEKDPIQGNWKKARPSDALKSPWIFSCLV